MRTTFLLFTVLILSGCSIINLQSESGVELINSDRVYKHLSYLASDSLKGRNTPSPELDTAAVYIANEFKKYGLQPVDRKYLHQVNLGIISLGDGNSFSITKNGKETIYSIKSDFVPFEMTATKTVTAPVVFAGYGITAPEYNYDDYKDIDVKDKVVFVLRHEPGENDSSSVFDGILLTGYSEVKYKVRNAIVHGAAGIIIVTDPLNHSSIVPRGFPWPSLSKIIPKDALPLLLISKYFNKIPVVNAGESIIKGLFGRIDSLKNLQSKIDKNYSPFSFELNDAAVSIETTAEINKQTAYNVAGYIEGSDPKLKEELLIIGAHYDHVGMKKEYSPGEDYIFNGADDNASGTSALLTIAEAFGALKEKPKRSVLFIAFAGEEKGLLGSEAYADQPLFPLEQTIAMLNLDMIGRNHPDRLEIAGHTYCPELKEINEEMNKKTGFSFIYTEEYIAQSDQAVFIRNNIPVLFYHTGDEPDYHKVTDEVHLIDTEKVARIAKLVFYTANFIANDHNRYRILSNKVSFF